MKERMESFLRLDEVTGCRLFTGGTKGGYGIFYIGNEQHWAHRVAWKLAGRDLPDDMCVLHSCDRPLCCSPEHLFLGTKGDNNADRARKGRSARGRHPFGVIPVRFKKNGGGFNYQVKVAPPGAGTCGARYLATYGTIEQAAAVARFIRAVSYQEIGMI
jgi:hypothetical protein